MSSFTTIEITALDQVNGGADENTTLGAGVQLPGGANANLSVTHQQSMSEYNKCLRDRAGEMAWGTSNQERAQIQQQLCGPLLTQPATAN